MQKKTRKCIKLNIKTVQKLPKKYIITNKRRNGGRKMKYKDDWGCLQVYIYIFMQ